MDKWKQRLLKQHMRIKKIFLSLLCLLTVAECFCINTKNIKAVEGELHPAIYERFLNNEEKACIDYSGDAGELFSFGKYTGKVLNLSEIINIIVNCYYSVDTRYDISIGKIEYAYLDCGNNGSRELAVKVGIGTTEPLYYYEEKKEDEDFVIYMIVKEISGQLKLAYSNVKYFDTEICINEHGYIERRDVDFKGDYERERVCKEYIDGSGDYHYIATESVFDKKFPYSNKIVRDAEKKRGKDRDYFAFSKSEIYPDGSVIYSADLNNTKNDENDDICCGKLFGHLNLMNYIKSAPYVYNLEEDIADAVLFKDRREVRNYIEPLGIKLYRQEEYKKILDAEEKKAGLTEDIKKGHELKWDKFDSNPDHVGIRLTSLYTGYEAYDALIHRTEKIIEMENYIGPFEAEEWTGISYAVFWEVFDDSSNVGYCRKDIDGDGVDELLIGTGNSEATDYDSWAWGWDNTVYDMFTIKEGRLVQVFSGGERARFYLCENGVIKEEWANSAFNSGDCFYRFEDGELKLIEEFYNDDGRIIYNKNGHKHEIADYWRYHKILESLANKYRCAKNNITPFVDREK